MMPSDMIERAGPVRRTKLAQASGVRGIRLHTNKLMTENIELYRRLGYRFEKETRPDGGMVAVHMIRRLTTSKP